MTTAGFPRGREPAWGVVRAGSRKMPRDGRFVEQTEGTVKSVGGTSGDQPAVGGELGRLTAAGGDWFDSLSGGEISLP